MALAETVRPDEPKSRELFNIDAEQALLGAILVNNEALRFVPSLRPDHFYDPVHAEIFRVAKAEIEAGHLVDPVNLKSKITLPVEFTADKELTLPKYLVALAVNATTVINAPDYARTVRDLADLRKLTGIGDLIRLMAEDENNPAEVGARAIDEIDAIIGERTSTAAPTVTMGQSVKRAVQAVADAYQLEDRLPGMSWGLTDMDYKTLGIQKGELTIIAGRPGMGKTALALCVARALAEAGHQGRFSSLEMGDIQLTQRVLSDMLYEDGPISYYNLRSGRFREEQFARVITAAKRAEHLPMTIDQQPGMTAAQIVARARQHKRKTGLDWFIVDHLHLVKPSDRYAGNMTSEIGEMTKLFRGFAKETNTAGIVLCQLSRQVESREDKRPNMSDLRWSGDIEQDADLVVMLYREEYYLRNREPIEGTEEWFAWEKKMKAAENRLEALVEKNRMGPTGTVRLMCSIANNACRNLAREDAR